MPQIHDTIAAVTARIEARSKDSRAAYLEMIRSRRPDGFARTKLTEGNLAHASAGCVVMDKTQLLGTGWPNIGIISSYNDMLSAHAPYEAYPELIRDEARKNTATAQVAGGYEHYLVGENALRLEMNATIKDQEAILNILMLVSARQP